MCFISRRFKRNHILATVNPVNSKCITPIAKESAVNISKTPPSSQALSQAIDHLRCLTQEHAKANQTALRRYKIMMHTKKSYNCALAKSNKLKHAVADFNFIVKNLKDQFGCTENPYSKPEITELDCDFPDTASNSDVLPVSADSEKEPAEAVTAAMPSIEKVSEAKGGSSSNINKGSKTTGEAAANYVNLEAAAGLTDGAAGHGV